MRFFKLYKIIKNGIFQKLTALCPLPASKTGITSVGWCAPVNSLTNGLAPCCLLPFSAQTGNTRTTPTQRAWPCSATTPSACPVPPAIDCARSCRSAYATSENKNPNFINAQGGSRRCGVIRNSHGGGKSEKRVTPKKYFINK